MPSAPPVVGPTIPSTPSCWAAWNARTAVLGLLAEGAVDGEGRATDGDLVEALLQALDLGTRVAPTQRLADRARRVELRS